MGCVFPFCHGLFDGDILEYRNIYIRRKTDIVGKNPTLPLSPTFNFPHSLLETSNINFQPVIEQKIFVVEC